MKNQKIYKCPICGSKKSTKNFKAYDIHGTKKLSKGKFSYSQCAECELVYITNLKVNKTYYDKYYKDDYYHNNGVRSGIADLLTKIANYFKNKIVYRNIQSIKKKNNILDIGAGDLKFLNSIDESFNKTAIDIKSHREAPSNIRFIEEDVLIHDFRQKYDVATMWHFLEHADRPVKLLKKINKILNKDGIVVFSMPNTESLSFKQVGTEWFHFDAPRHLALYSEKSVEKLAEESNFELIKSYNLWYEFPTDLFWSVRNYKYKFLIYLFYPFIKFFSSETTCYVFKKN